MSPAARVCIYTVRALAVPPKTLYNYERGKRLALGLYWFADKLLIRRDENSPCRNMGSTPIRSTLR